MSESLELRVRSHPDDRDAWSILGDQLQEQGDAAGELIALSLHAVPDHARVEELRQELLAPVARFLEDDSLRLTWRNGVPHRASITGTEAHDSPASTAVTLPLERLAQLPIARFLRELELVDVIDDVTRTLDEGFFDGLARLDFDAYDKGEAPRKVGAAGLRALAKGRRIAQLESLSLGGQRIGDRGAAMLAEAPVDALRSLSLIGNEIGEVGMARLAGSPRLAGLRSLNLHWNRFGDEGLGHLVGSPHLVHLAELTLGSNGLGQNGIKRLARSPNLASVETLVLNMDPVGNLALRSLVTSRHAAKLASLTLASCEVDAAGVEALAASPLLGQLRELGLPSNAVGDAGVFALTASPSRLTRLNLEFNGVTAAGLVALAECPHLASLDELWLWGDAEPARGIDALLASRYLSDRVKKSLTWQFGLGPEPAEHVSGPR